MISMMSKGYCDEHGYEIQPLHQLVPIEGSGRANVPYLVLCNPKFILKE